MFTLSHREKTLLKRHHLVLLLIRYLYKIGENQTLRGCNCLEFLISNLQQFIQSTLVPNCRRGSNMHQEENYQDFLNKGELLLGPQSGIKECWKVLMIPTFHLVINFSNPIFPHINNKSRHRHKENFSHFGRILSVKRKTKKNSLRLLVNIRQKKGLILASSVFTYYGWI